MPNFNLCRQAKNNDIGKAVFIVPDQDGGRILPGVLTEVVPGRHYARFVVRLDDGQGSIRVHPAAVRFAPALWLRDRPAYLQDEVYAFAPRYGAEKVRIVDFSASRPDVVTIQLINPSDVFVNGVISLSALYWAAEDVPKVATPARPAAGGVAASASLLARDKFINLYESLPNGSRLIPGSMVFYSMDDAARGKHSAPLLGTYKLTPVA